LERFENGAPNTDGFLTTKRSLTRNTKIQDLTRQLAPSIGFIKERIPEGSQPAREPAAMRANRVNSAVASEGPTG
jgi:hypothetical protein